MSLKDAAAKVSIKKKTLDDYYIQLKTAYLTGFPLENPQSIHMGMIRKHNKEYETQRQKSEPKK